MADAASPPGEAVGAPHRDERDPPALPRRGLSDLAALLALPAMWVHHDPPDIAASLLGVLFGVLRLESGYARFDEPAGGPALERWRPTGPCAPIELGPALAAEPVRAQGAVTISVPAPDGTGTVRVTSMAPTLLGEGGLVLVSSRRNDFPTDHELYLLRVAVSQAVIAIHTARRLASERAARLAAEAALRRRDAFLATLARDLASPLATLSEHAARAHALATGTDHPAALAGAMASTDALRGDAPAPETGTPPLAPPPRLTRREAEVLGLLAQGLSNKEIAALLWLSDRTVERHITSLYRKIEVERRSEATAFALRNGLVTAGTRAD